MALKRFWFGSVGPLLYDPSKSYPGDDPTPVSAFRTDGDIVVGGTVFAGALQSVNSVGTTSAAGLANVSSKIYAVENFR